MDNTEEDPFADPLDDIQYSISPTESPNFREDVDSPDSQQEHETFKLLDRAFYRWRGAMETLSKEPLYEIYTEKGHDPRLKLDLSQTFDSKTAINIISTDETLRAAMSGRHLFWRDSNPIHSAFIRSGFKTTAVRQSTSIIEIAFACELGSAFSARIPSPVVVVCSLVNRRARDTEDGGFDLHWREIFRRAASSPHTL
jgi:hypothetical protein